VRHEDDSDRESERLGSSDSTSPREDAGPQQSVPPHQVIGNTTAGQTSPEIGPVPQIEIHDDYTGWSRLETNARGVRIRNVWSRYDIPWAAVRDIDIVEAMWRGSGSPYGYELRFTVARDTNPGQPTTARPEGSGPNTGDPGRFELVKAHATKTKTGSSILPKSIQPDQNLEDVRTAILAARNAALAVQSGEGDAVEVGGAARILWNLPRTRSTLRTIGLITMVLVGWILTVWQVLD
jgi:hypothetical protein